MYLPTFVEDNYWIYWIVTVFLNHPTQVQSLRKSRMKGFVVS